MPLTKFSMEFKQEDWIDMNYPITVRLASFREKQAALEELGLPPPFDPVVWLDRLSRQTDSTWDVATTRRLVRSMSPDAVKDYYRQQCRIVDGRKPTRGSCPSKTIFEGRLKDWQRSASVLLNLYAAAVYQDQMAMVHTTEDSNSSISSNALTRTWECEAWDTKLAKLKAENVSVSYAKRESDDSEMAMIQGFAKRLQKHTNEADDTGSTTQIVEDQVEISDSAATTDASGLVSEPSVSNNTRHIQQRRASVMLDGGLQPQNEGSEADLHTTSTTVPSARSKLSTQPAFSNADSKTIYTSVGDGNIHSFTDHRGINHHRSTGGNFVKGAGAARGANRGKGRWSTRRSANAALGDSDERQSDGERADELPPSGVVGSERRLSAAQPSVLDSSDRLATEAPATKRTKLSHMQTSPSCALSGESEAIFDGAGGSLGDKTTTGGGKDDGEQEAVAGATTAGMGHFFGMDANQQPVEEPGPLASATLTDFQAIANARPGDAVSPPAATTPRRRLVLKNSGPRPKA